MKSAHPSPFDRSRKRRRSPQHQPETIAMRDGQLLIVHYSDRVLGRCCQFPVDNVNSKVKDQPPDIDWPKARNRRTRRLLPTRTPLDISNRERLKPHQQEPRTLSNSLQESQMNCCKLGQYSVHERCGTRLLVQGHNSLLFVTSKHFW